MRESEEWLLNTEKYSSLAWLQGVDYPAAKLTDAWKQVLFNQFHDLAAGSGIGIIYKEAQRDYDRVRWTGNEVSHSALETIQSRIDTRTKEGVPVLVFNPLAWERSGAVMVTAGTFHKSAESVSVLDAKGNVLPSKLLSREPHSNIYHLLVNAGPVPSMGYKLIHVVPGNKTFPTDLKVSGTTIENASLRVTVDPTTGCITSLFKKKSNFESFAPNSCGNELQAFSYTTERIRRLEHRPRHPRPAANADSPGRFSQGRRTRPNARRHSSGPHLAKLQIRAGDLSRRQCR